MGAIAAEFNAFHHTRAAQDGAAGLEAVMDVSCARLDGAHVRRSRRGAELESVSRGECMPRCVVNCIIRSGMASNLRYPSGTQQTVSRTRVVARVT